jgi:hypothetical protein
MNQRTLLATPLATVKTTRQKWAAVNQVPLGTITILAGESGIAKSTVLGWFIAEWTQGRLEGDLFDRKATVAIINGEDDPSTVLKPRLQAAGADLDHVISLSDVRVQDETGEDWITAPGLQDDLHSIREQLIELGAKILIIDPIISLMQGDSHRLEDVRKNLDPLASLAADLGIAVICVAHFNKGAGKAGDKVSGSHAFRDIARSLLLLAVDEETDERILTVEKSNYSPIKPSVAFQVDSVSVPTDSGEHAIVGRATMLGPSSVTVQDLLNRDTTVLGERSSDLIDYVNEHPEGVRAENVADALSIPIEQARTYLSRAAKSGRIDRAGRGVYVPQNNSNTTTANPVSSVRSVINPSNTTQITHATDLADVRAVLRSPDCPEHGTPTHDGICGRCEAEKLEAAWAQ